VARPATSWRTFDDLAPGCNSENTKLPELRFRAVLGNGARGVRFERVLRQ
jgi:hypothetical protein